MLEHLTSESLSAAFLLRSLTSNDHHPHLLVDCGRFEVDCILLGLHQWGTAPIRHCRLPGPLTLPRARRGTLLIENLHQLNLAQQLALYDWMTPGTRHIQIISTTTRVIDSLVANGEFLEGLFYRLNVVRLAIQARDDAAGSFPFARHE